MFCRKLNKNCVFSKAQFCVSQTVTPLIYTHSNNPLFRRRGCISRNLPKFTGLPHSVVSFSENPKPRRWPKQSCAPKIPCLSGLSKTLGALVLFEKNIFGRIHLFPTPSKHFLGIFWIVLFFFLFPFLCLSFYSIKRQKQKMTFFEKRTFRSGPCFGYTYLHPFANLHIPRKQNKQTTWTRYWLIAWTSCCLIKPLNLDQMITLHHTFTGRERESAIFVQISGSEYWKFRAPKNGIPHPHMTPSYIGTTSTTNRKVISANYLWVEAPLTRWLWANTSKDA